jgi:hypothetical protein
MAARNRARRRPLPTTWNISACHASKGDKEGSFISPKLRDVKAFLDDEEISRQPWLVH